MKIEAASGAQTQTCVCRNLNQNECTRRKAMGVGTQDSTRRRATGVGTICGILFLRSHVLCLRSTFYLDPWRILVYAA